MAETAELRSKAAGRAASSSAAMPPADLVARALRTVDISRILVASGTIGSLKVGNIQLGQATIDRLVIRDVAAGVHSGKAFFENLRLVIRVEVIVDWWFDVLFSSGKGRDTFTSPLIPLELGNLLVPSLQDIDFLVPQATVDDARAHLEPVRNLDLGGGRFDDVKADATRLPSDGFGVSGLEVGAFTLSEVGVPATATERVSVAEFRPSGAVTLPGVEVAGVEVPAAQVPRVVSDGPVNIFDLQPQDPYPIGGLDLGVFGFSIAVKPLLDLQIGVLILDDVTLQASIGSLRLENVTTPVTVQDIRLGDVRLQQVTVNQIAI